MARRVRAPKLETRTNRLKLPVQRKPIFITVAPGIGLGYRRNQGAGVWVVRAADGHGGNWTKAFAVADDHEDATGESVLDYWAAQDRARQLARGGGGNGDRPATVAEALDHYEQTLRARGGDSVNASRVRLSLPPALASKTVSLLGARELRHWRDGLVKRGRKPATADRIARALKAALNLAATDDPRITNAGVWRTGLVRLPDAENARNEILPDEDVRKLIAASYQTGSAFGLLIKLAAITGQRAGQLLALTVADLQDGAAPRLLVPSSRKGRRRRVERKSLPIPVGLAAKLQAAAVARRGGDPLLARDDGARWKRIPVLTFRQACAKAGLDPKLTPYCLRHSSVVRMLLAGVPIRVVASVHDTSTAMIEKTYSRHIVGDPSEVLLRRALLDTEQSMAVVGNVVPLAGRS